MKNINLIISILCLLVFGVCIIDEQFDFNVFSVSVIFFEVEFNELDFLVYGVEVWMWMAWDMYIIFMGLVVWELYLFDVDFCNIEDLLGKEGCSLDNNIFYFIVLWGICYQVVKNVNLLLDVFFNVQGVFEVEFVGYCGYVRIVKVLMFLQEFMCFNDNGIWVDVVDLENFGLFVSKVDVFIEIFSLLDDVYDDFQGVEFYFVFLVGYVGGFDILEGYVEFNCVIVVWVVIYVQ